ncbi:MAG: response regulator [Pirellulales bacterium]|nr:response regulator [Pirellulales bacterium]
MLVLSRDCDTVVRIGPDIRVKVLSIRRQRVKLGIDAPKEIRVWREEVLREETDLTSLGNSPPAAGAFPVLVVEDDPDHADLIHRILSDCRLPEVTIAPTGTAAIDVLGVNGSHRRASVPPRLILLDLNLPDMPGLEVLRRVRASYRLRMLPVVVLSGVKHEALVADCLRAGANAFVRKSPHFQEFRDSVSRIATFWSSDCRVPASIVEPTV